MGVNLLKCIVCIYGNIIIKSIESVKKARVEEVRVYKGGDYDHSTLNTCMEIL